MFYEMIIIIFMCHVHGHILLRDYMKCMTFDALRIINFQIRQIYIFQIFTKYVHIPFKVQALKNYCGNKSFAQNVI